MRFLENSFWIQLLRIAIAAPLGIFIVRMFQLKGFLPILVFLGIYMVVALVLEAIKSAKSNQ